MKNQINKSRYLFVCLVVLMIVGTSESYGQRKNKVYLYSKVMAGYGSIFDRFDVTTPGQSGPITAKHRESHGNGLNIDIAIGGTLSKSKRVSKYSNFDFFALHRQLMASESFFSFSGIGLQGRKQKFHANIVLGYAFTSEEVPNKRDEMLVIGYGKMQGFAFGGGFGLNIPTEERSPLIMCWDVNFLFPKNEYDDLSGFLHFTWFSTSLGLKYYITNIR
jgi:hypothetical protein